MNEERESHGIGEPGAEEALSILERRDDGLAAEVSEEARDHLGVLAALPYALEPIEPSAALRASILERIGTAPEAGEPVAPAATVAAAEPRAGRSSSWMLPLAAVLALLLLGLSARQWVELAEREERIVAQAERIERLEGELERRSSVPVGLPDWMASSGTELCALRPREAATERTRGWLFVREDHQHWYVTVEGLAPTPEGHVYELWFLVDGELVSAGAFHPDADGRAVLTSESMPNPVTGIAVTLERDDGDGVPSETMVLWGDEVMVTL